MASSVATPLERQFSTIAGLDSMISTNGLGSTQITLSSPWTGTSTPPPRTCRRPSPRRASAAAAGHADPAVLPEGQPGGPADPVPRPDLAHPAAVHGRRVRRDADRPAHLDGQRRGPGAGLRLAEVRRARPARPRRPGRRGASASTRWRRRVGSGNVNLPTGTLYGPHQAFTRPGHRPAHGRRRVPPADRRLPQRRARSACGTSGRVDRQRRERQGRRPGTTTTRAIVLAIQRQPGTNTVEVVDAIRQLLPDVPRPSCPPRSTWTSCTTAPSRSATRSTT